jgi:hypothetical protein
MAPARSVGQRSGIIVGKIKSVLFVLSKSLMTAPYYRKELPNSKQ